jgi:hypothetical protein
VFVGIALALLLFASFGRLAEVFSKDPMVIQIVRGGVLVCIFFYDTIWSLSTLSLLMANLCVFEVC